MLLAAPTHSGGCAKWDEQSNIWRETKRNLNERPRNVYENKGVLLKSCGRSRYLIENKCAYQHNPVILLKTKELNYRIARLSCDFGSEGNSFKRGLAAHFHRTRTSASTAIMPRPHASSDGCLRLTKSLRSGRIPQATGHLLDVGGREGPRGPQQYPDRNFFHCELRAWLPTSGIAY